jgi:hypothetical protein
MGKSFRYLLYTFLVTAIYITIIVFVGEVYFSYKLKYGAINAFGNEIVLVVYLLIGFFAVLLLFLIVKLFNSDKKMVKDAVYGYLYSSIYVFILLTTISCVYFLKL